MFDNVCKFLAETFSTDFASWLIGEPIALTELSPSELSLEPIRADALILLESPEVILHLEFQTNPDKDIPFRMIDYRVRGYRRFPEKRMYQVVIYLKETGSEEVYKNTFSIPGTLHEFNVIRLWEQPKEVLSQYVGLLPFAVLCQADEGGREATLKQVAREIDRIDDRRQQSNVAAAAAILAGLVLNKGLIKKVMKKEIMKESVIYQDIWDEASAEAHAKGHAEGHAEGIEEGVQRVAVNLLRNGITPEDVVKFTGLTLEEVQSLRSQLN